MYLQCALELAKAQDFEHGSKKKESERNDLPQSRKRTDFPRTKERLSRIKRAKALELFIFDISRLLQQVTGNVMKWKEITVAFHSSKYSGLKFRVFYETNGTVFSGSGWTNQSQIIRFQVSRDNTRSNVGLSYICLLALGLFDDSEVEINGVLGEGDNITFIVRISKESATFTVSLYFPDRKSVV